MPDARPNPRLASEYIRSGFRRRDATDMHCFSCTAGPAASSNGLLLLKTSPATRRSSGWSARTAKASKSTSA